MAKYYDYQWGGSLIYDKDGFQVYHPCTLHGLYLVRNGKKIAEKLRTDLDNRDIEKWIQQWVKNANEQIYRLKERMEVLRDEQQEIMALLK